MLTHINNFQISNVDEKQLNYFILFSLTFLAFVTRIYGIAEWDITGDEVYTVERAADRYNTFINPAYYILVLISFEIFGVNEFSARFPAVILGILSVPVFYLTWQNIFGRSVALIGALIIVFSGWHLYYSQFSRFYSGVFLFGSLSYYYYLQALRFDSLKYMIWSMVAGLIATSFHATAIMVIVSCGSFSFLLMIFKDPRLSQYSKRIAKIYFYICVACGMILSIRFWQMLMNRQSRGLTWGDPPLEMFFQITRAVQLPIAVSAFFGFLMLLKDDFWKATYLFISIGISIAFVMFVAQFLNSRSVYMFYSLPLIFILSAYFVQKLGQSLSMNYRFSTLMVMSFIIFMLLPEMLSHYTGNKSMDVRQAVKFVEDMYKPGDIVLPFDDSFIYYARGKYPMEPPELGSPYVNKEWDAILEPYLKKNRRIWIVLERHRDIFANSLENWLRKHAVLEWRNFEKRLDYEVSGYEIYLVNKPSLGISQIDAR